MKVQTVMNPDVKFAGTDASVADVARMMGKNGFGVVPIVNAENRVVGIITDRDICLEVAHRPLPAIAIPVIEVMTRRVYCCRPDDDVVICLQTMRNKRVRRLPVIDHEGKLVGILSMDDIVLNAEKGRGTKVRPTYGETVKTLKAIYRQVGKETIAARI